MLMRGSKQKSLFPVIPYKNVDTNLTQIKYILSKLRGIFSEIASLTLLSLRIRKGRYHKVRFSCRRPIEKCVAVYENN